jgi:hypothetical protein
LRGGWFTRSVYQYEPRPNRDGPIIELLLEREGIADFSLSMHSILDAEVALK